MYRQILQVVQVTERKKRGEKKGLIAESEGLKFFSELQQNHTKILQQTCNTATKDPILQSKFLTLQFILQCCIIAETCEKINISMHK